MLLAWAGFALILTAAFCDHLNQRWIKLWGVSLVLAITTIFWQSLQWKEINQLIDWKIIFYLYGMFVFGYILEKGKYLEYLVQRYLTHKDSSKSLLHLTFFLGIGSALLMNDTMAIIASSIIIGLSLNKADQLKPFAYCSAYAITIGSVFSPIGNPQNMIIAQYLQHSFAWFVIILTIPTMLSLYICYKCTTYFYRDTFQATHINISQHPEITYMPYAKQCLSLFLVLIFVHIIVPKLPIGAIALLSTLPYWLDRHRQTTTLIQVDWRTLCFFIGMFIFIPQAGEAVSSTVLNDCTTSLHGIFVISITLSQLLSNVPTVMLLAPLIESTHHIPVALLALATSSTLAGNFLIIGAASNIILFQALRLKGYNLYKVQSFLLLGTIITLPSALIYLGWLNIVKHFLNA